MAFRQISAFTSRFRRDIDGGVGDDQRLGITRYVHQITMRHAPLGAQAGFPHDDGAQQFIGMQRALHDGADFSLRRQGCGFGRRGMAMRHIDERPGRNINAGRLCCRPDTRRGANQRRRDQIFTGGVENRLQHIGLHG